MQVVHEDHQPPVWSILPMFSYRFGNILHTTAVLPVNEPYALGCTVRIFAYALHQQLGGGCLFVTFQQHLAMLLQTVAKHISCCLWVSLRHLLLVHKSASAYALGHKFCVGCFKAEEKHIYARSRHAVCQLKHEGGLAQRRNGTKYVQARIKPTVQCFVKLGYACRNWGHSTLAAHDFKEVCHLARSKACTVCTGRFFCQFFGTGCHGLAVFHKLLQKVCISFKQVICIFRPSFFWQLHFGKLRPKFSKPCPSLLHGTFACPVIIH